MTTTGLLRNLSLVFSFSALIACGSDGGGPPAPLNESAISPPADGPGTILEVAQSAGNFETLLTALEAAGLDTWMTPTASSRFLHPLTRPLRLCLMVRWIACSPTLSN